MVRRGLAKQGYTEEEIQRAYEIAKQEYQTTANEKPVNANVKITLLPANDNDSNKNTNDV